MADFARVLLGDPSITHWKELEAYSEAHPAKYSSVFEVLLNISWIEAGKIPESAQRILQELSKENDRKVYG